MKTTNQSFIHSHRESRHSWLPNRFFVVDSVERRSFFVAMCHIVLRSTMPTLTALALVASTAAVGSAAVCGGGLYAAEGRGACGLACPLGSFCPEGERSALPCPAGRFGSVRGLRTAECSGPAASGYWTPAGAASATARPCASASDANALFCPPGSAAPRAVALNHYSVGGDARTRGSQRACPSGSHCVRGRRVACAAGRYGVACADVCPTGAYCPAGSAAPTLCESGRFGANESLGGVGCAAAPRGRYALEGAAQPTDCPAGRFGSRSGLTGSTCEGPCAAGYWCPARSTSASARACGGSDVFCPIGSAAPTPVRRGFYSVDAAGSASAASGARTQAREVRCAAGWACEAGARRACAAGRYADRAEVATFACSGPCAAGFYCAAGSPSRTQRACGGARVYCPEGSAAPRDAPRGRFTVGGDEGARAATLECPTGSFCVGGVRRRCPAGTYGASLGLASARCTAPAPAGRYAVEGSELPLDCPAGRYGDRAGLKDAQCSGASRRARWFRAPLRRAPVAPPPAPASHPPPSGGAHRLSHAASPAPATARAVREGALLRRGLEQRDAAGVRERRVVLPRGELGAARRRVGALLDGRRRVDARRAARVRSEERTARRLPRLDPAVMALRG